MSCIFHTRKSVSKVDRQKKKKICQEWDSNPRPLVCGLEHSGNPDLWCLLPRHGPLATGGPSAILAADGLHRGKW